MTNLIFQNACSNRKQNSSGQELPNHGIQDSNSLIITLYHQLNAGKVVNQSMLLMPCAYKTLVSWQSGEIGTDQILIVLEPLHGASNMMGP